MGAPGIIVLVFIDRLQEILQQLFFTDFESLKYLGCECWYIFNTFLRNTYNIIGDQEM